MDEQKPADNDHDAKYYNEQGIALTAEEKYGDAITQYKLAIARDAKFYAAYYNWGLSLYNQGLYEEAIEQFEKAAKLNDNYASAYYNWGLSLYNQKKYEEAIEQFTKATKANDKHANAFYSWGLILYEQKKYAEAVVLFKKATEANDKHADAFYNLGLALYSQKKYEEAADASRRAAELSNKTGSAFYVWALALAGQKVYEAAIEKYRESIGVYEQGGVEADQIWATYARHNIANLIWRQGKYKEGKKEWEETHNAYQGTERIAIRLKDGDYFNNFGSMLHSALDDLKGAESAYKKGLEIKPNHVGILTNLVSLYIEQKDNRTEKSTGLIRSFLNQDEDPNELPATSAYWKARESFVKARGILEAQSEQVPNDDVFSQLGQLFLALGSYLTTAEYERAKGYLLTAFEKDKASSNVCASLGVLYAWMEDYQKAVRYLGDAVKLEPDDLALRSNLAEAHLKAGSIDRAESEYRKVLDVTKYQVESHIGLGEVYKAMGDADDDSDMYFRAIQEFSEGMRIAGKAERSRKLTGKNFAAACYSRGYARVKLYEVTKLARDESLLNKARADFRRARDNDSEHYKAARALEKIGKRFGFRAAQRLIEKLGPWILFSLSLGVFGFAQASFFFGKFRVKDSEPLLNAGYYVLLTFGSLIWMVASISLPQLLKLKVAGIELEKSAVDQITTPTALEISR